MAFIRSHNHDAYICASEHSFNFSLSSVLLIKTLAQKRGFKFCSQIGGCESIRDMRQAQVVGADAIECGFVESAFAYSKFLNSLRKIWETDDSTTATRHVPNRLFLTVHSLSAIDNLLLILDRHRALNAVHSLVPVLDRRSMAKEILKIDGDNFDLVDYESELNTNLTSLDILRSHPFCISGGITSDSLNKMMHLGLIPSFVKTGLFIFKLDDYSEDSVVKSVEFFQLTEAIVLEVLRAIDLDQLDYSSKRQTRLLLEFMRRVEV